jgi:hypothetical protein
MRTIRYWLIGAALLAGAANVAGQGPGEPPIAAALPGGTVVGSNQPLLGSASVLTPDTLPQTSPPPAAGAPIVTIPPAAPPGVLPPVPGGLPCAAPGPNGNCCGPIGAHGPIGQEVYLRIGPSFPIGDSNFPRNLNTGIATQIGGRSQFFNAAGDAAWAIDAHLTYTYNNAGGRDIVTFQTEPVIIRGLQRWAVGLGFGRDMFLVAPGFVAGTWDANFRLGWDVGARLGTGHVDLTPLLEPDGYRRHQDTFGQTFVGAMGTMEIPVGGYTALGGLRIEWDYTWSQFLPKSSNFHEVNVLAVMGVRY